MGFQTFLNLDANSWFVQFPLQGSSRKFKWRHSPVWAKKFIKFAWIFRKYFSKHFRFYTTFYKITFSTKLLYFRLEFVKLWTLCGPNIVEMKFGYCFFIIIKKLYLDKAQLTKKLIFFFLTEEVTPLCLGMVHL